MINRQTKVYGQWLNAAMLTVAIIFIVGCSKKTPQQAKEASTEKTVPIEVKTVETVPVPVKIPLLKTPWRQSLNEVINTARQWSPILINWYEKELPDFSARDIAGNLHTISDYRGKNVMIVLWATWCTPCLEEIPHLIALENIISRDNLPVKILAISNEDVGTIKNFAIRKKINYTVASSPTIALPKPLNSVQAIPTTFFIDPQGKIKLVIQGSAYLGELKTIVLAQ